MTKTFTTTFAAALVAASALGASAAFAGGDYYVGGAPASIASQTIDQVRTHSIGERAIKPATETQVADRGEYRSMAPVASK